MRFTPSANWSLLEKCPSTLLWSAYVRSGSDISTNLASGSWFDISQYISTEELPAVASRIEYEVGVFTVDSLSLTAYDIAHFTSSIFTSASLVDSNTTFEVKLQLNLTDGTTTTTDNATVFSGFVDKDSLTYNELNDSITFGVNTADQIGAGMSAATVNTKYISTFVTLGDISACPGIPGMYVVDATSSFGLDLGIHTLEFTPSGNSGSVSLDGGRSMVLPYNATTMSVSNGKTALEDSQTVKIFTEVSHLPTTGSHFEKLIVTQSNSILPMQLYHGGSVEDMLTRLYSKIGITTVSFSTMSVSSYDASNRIVNLSTLSYSSGSSYAGPDYAAAASGSDVYIGAANYIWRRKADGSYVYVAMLNDPENKIRRMWFNARNNHLWLYYTTGTQYHSVGQLACATNVLTTGPTLGQNANTYWSGMDLIDYNYTGASYLYGLLVGQPGNGVDIVSGSTMLVSNLYSEAAANTTLLTVNGGTVYWTLSDVINASSDVYESTINASGLFSGTILLTKKSPVPNFGRKDITGTHFYFVTGENLEWDRPDVPASGSVLNFAGSDLQGITQGASGMYITVSDTGSFLNGTLYSLSAGSATEIAHGTYTKVDPIVTIGGVVYGMGTNGYFWKLGNVIPFYMNDVDYSEKSIIEFINEILRAFNLVANVNSQKGVYIYNRADSSGDPVDTGSTLSLTEADVTSLTTSENSLRNIKLLKVISGDVTVTYDGSDFNTGVFGDVKTTEISSEFIPQDIMKDLAYSAWQFFRQNRTIYNISMDSYPAFEWEPLDGCSITFTSTKIKKTSTGIIYSVEGTREGNITIEVLV